MQILLSLLAGLKAVCATFPDARKGRGGNIEISDFGVSAFSTFFMQSASFLAYQARAGERPGSLQRPDPVRDRQNSPDNYIRRRPSKAGPAPDSDRPRPARQFRAWLRPRPPGPLRPGPPGVVSSISSSRYSTAS